jgi:hypothetical protein
MENQIPIPKWKMPKEADLLLQMSVGGNAPAEGVIVQKCYEIARALGMVITCRAGDDGVYRIWRLL